MTEAVPNHESVHHDSDPDVVDPVDVGPDGPGLPPPTALESLVNALLDSGPEVAEHVVRAAQELILAAQTIVDAAERAVDEQQDLHRSAEETPGPTATVHPIDRTE